MAKRTNLQLFLSTDQDLAFTILNATGSVAVDIAGWSFSWMAKYGVEDQDNEALITNTAATVSGTFNADPDVNTQIATVSLADTDTESVVPGEFVWELKRTTDGFETILAYGRLSLLRAVHR